MDSIKIKPLSDEVGAEVSGIDCSLPINEDIKQELLTAFHRYQLLCLKSNVLEPKDFARTAQIFGRPKMQFIRSDRDDDAPEVSRLDSTYASIEDKPDDISMVRLSGWHTDDSYLHVPAKITLLQSINIPAWGGETRFANTKSAYEDLEAAEQAELKQLTAIHLYDTVRAKGRPKTLNDQEKAETVEAEHPLIRRHDETGTLSLYFNANRTDRIKGWTREDSDRLLDRIDAHLCQEKYQYHHKWSVGDILIWDNRNLIHSVNMDFPVAEKRVHQRILVQGTKPFI